MSVVSLPLRPDLPSYDMQVALDGVNYTVELRWNVRDEAWYMGLRTEDGDAISLSAKVVIGMPLIGRCADERRPPGLFVAVDTTGAGADPGLAELGGRVLIYYYPLADQAALAAL